ncbi:hypothetical protein QBC46DRAFT_434101 [Diplogelasinospora grovesii]|uniref:Thaumatin-like protein n=1 Tax=Diplogelasinospora grovesii TaxID=303347 RepID=A0AAN6NBJ6_9PEZI|nr:hypothetical protein QBC46DRAFT_434101 [Diplogelasinospora grovesii]
MLIQVGPIAVLTFTTTAGAALKVVESGAYVKPTLGGAIANAHPVPTTASVLTEGAVLTARINPPPEYLTIAINSQNGPISTSHASNVGAPTPIWGDNGPGTFPSGGAAAFIVPTGWAGNVAISDALRDGARPVPWADSSLIEASFVIPDGYGMAVADIDVSYVNGFSGAITCACSGVVVAGCNLRLWDMNACPDDKNGVCVNPLRADTTATAAPPFFAPCQGAAYTFPNDNEANSWAQCQSGEITCCVGEDCPPNPKQPPNSRGG